MAPAARSAKPAPADEAEEIFASFCARFGASAAGAEPDRRLDSEARRLLDEIVDCLRAGARAEAAAHVRRLAALRPDDLGIERRLRGLYRGIGLTEDAIDRLLRVRRS